MLSYRHAFHAGNHADVLKHFVLSLLLDYANKKNKPYWYIDTHAGAGLYCLMEGYAAQNAEFKDGIDKLISAKYLPKELASFVSQIKKFNHDTLRFYPGSPAIARQFLRPDDKMRLFELHPSDYKLLIENFKGHEGHVKVEMRDGFAGIKSCLPPPPRRATILIDPPYEDKQDYHRVFEMVNDSLSRFSTGTYIVWYPLLQRPEPAEMITKLIALNQPNWLNVEMKVNSPSSEGFGMYGSGLFIINPPWTLPNLLEEIMPTLTKILAQDNTANYSIHSNIA